MKILKLKRVEITWIDCQSIDEWEMISDVIKDFESPDTFLTCGYLLKKTKDFYIVTPSVHLDSRANLVKSGSSWAIPIGCVKKVKYL